MEELELLAKVNELQEDAEDAEKASVQADKDLIDAQAWAVSRHRAAVDARRALTKFKMQHDI